MDRENCNYEGWNVNSSSPEAAAPVDGRKKRGRTRKCKNKEEVESQRMTHIAIERNRRKQMNEYLGVLRSLMPPSYARRGDQASIVGGAINFAMELEQLLQSLEARKRIKKQSEAVDCSSSSSSTTTTNPFADFFTFPRYSSFSKTAAITATTISKTNESMAENRSMEADIEVTMVESQANLKVLTRRRPTQLLKMVMGLQNLRLTTLHLNVTSLDQLVLYSFNLKVEDYQFTSVDKIETAVHRLVRRIQDEAGDN